MHAILVTVGTDGDVFPYLGLGAMLRGGGAIGSPWSRTRNRKSQARDLGLGFRALLTDEEASPPLADPDFWHPIKGGGLPRDGSRRSSIGNLSC